MASRDACGNVTFMSTITRKLFQHFFCLSLTPSQARHLLSLSPCLRPSLSAVQLTWASSGARWWGGEGRESKCFFFFFVSFCTCLVVVRDRKELFKVHWHTSGGRRRGSVGKEKNFVRLCCCTLLSLSPPAPGGLPGTSRGRECYMNSLPFRPHSRRNYRVGLVITYG